MPAVHAELQLPCYDIVDTDDTFGGWPRFTVPAGRGPPHKTGALLDTPAKRCSSSD
nr:hypothetical protein GCM10020063_039500 [Dactylosporangium thailandense]